MKSTVAPWETVVYCVRIVATDGTTIRFAGYPHDLTMSNATVYATDSGYEFTGFDSTNNTAPSVIDLEGILLAAGIDRDGLLAGSWDNARAFVFATDWSNPVEDEEPIGKFILGKIKLVDDRYVCELMHLIDALNQSTGRSYGPLCPWTLFDANLDGDTFDYSESRCTGPRSSPDGPVDVTVSPNTVMTIATEKVTGTITSVTSKSVFTDSSRAEATDFFTAGSIRFTSGANNGFRSQEIKSFSSGGVITLLLDLPKDLTVGDAYEMIPGCRKRRDEDCVTKFNNGQNFGGFADIITSEQYAARGTHGA